MGLIGIPSTAVILVSKLNKSYYRKKRDIQMLCSVTDTVGIY